MYGVGNRKSQRFRTEHISQERHMGRRYIDESFTNLTAKGLDRLLEV